MRVLNTGDEVTYKSDVHTDYTGQSCRVLGFDLEYRIVLLECRDGQSIAAFWDEIE